MRYNLIIGLLLLVVIAGCTQSMNMHDDDMDDLPCHMMPGGEMMGDCDEPDNDDGDHMREGTAGDGMMMGSMMGGMQDELLPGQEHSLDSLSSALSSSIIDVADGETYKITAEIIKKNINGKELTMYGYNGMIPGPALRVKQGSTINVIFENKIDMNTTIHWHGLRHDIENDGVPSVSQDPVASGDSFTYELYFPDDGIFWYHPHVREDIQQDAGLAGNMLVIPTQAYNPVNREELIVLDDILVDEKGQMVPFGKEHANFAIMGRFGNVMLTSGETDYSLSVKKGEVVRLYVTNVANVRPFNFSVAGAQMKLVGGDLGQFEHEEFVDSIIIAPAVRFIVDVLFEESGSYNLMNANPHQSYVLGTIEVSEEETDISYVESFTQDLRNQYVIDYIASFEEYFDKDVDYHLDLTIDMMGMMDSMANMPCHSMGGMIMGDCSGDEREDLESELGHENMTIEWEDEMNMKASAAMIEWIIEDASTQLQNMDVVMQATVGDVVKIRLFNDPESLHPMQHPIHLHGQRFLITQMDGVNVENKVWTDTILVPIGSTVDILVHVTNPGNWMMHCHIAEHLEAGMMASFNVEDK